MQLHLERRLPASRKETFQSVVYYGYIPFLCIRERSFWIRICFMVSPLLLWAPYLLSVDIGCLLPLSTSPHHITLYPSFISSDKPSLPRILIKIGHSYSFYRRVPSLEPNPLYPSLPLISFFSRLTFFSTECLHPPLWSSLPRPVSSYQSLGT